MDWPDQWHVTAKCGHRIRREYGQKPRTCQICWQDKQDMLAHQAESAQRDHEDHPLIEAGFTTEQIDALNEWYERK